MRIRYALLPQDISDFIHPQSQLKTKQQKVQRKKMRTRASLSKYLFPISTFSCIRSLQSIHVIPQIGSRRSFPYINLYKILLCLPSILRYHFNYLFSVSLLVLFIWCNCFSVCFICLVLQFTKLKIIFKLFSASEVVERGCHECIKLCHKNAMEECRMQKRKI